MKVTNKTKNVILAQSAVSADNPFKRMKGLLGKKEFLPGEALILRPCSSVHTLFMRFPIDVLFVNKENRVIHSIASLKPFRLTRIYPLASFAIEFPSGTLKVNPAAVGDIISIG